MIQYQIIMFMSKGFLIIKLAFLDEENCSSRSSRPELSNVSNRTKSMECKAMISNVPIHQLQNIRVHPNSSLQRNKTKLCPFSIKMSGFDIPVVSPSQGSADALKPHQSSRQRSPYPVPHPHQKSMLKISKLDPSPKN